MAGSTPVYGFPYPEATDLVADYPALGQELAEDIEAALPTVGGLAPATPTTIANSGGSASLSGNTVTFTGVSSVSLNGCFTGDYDNYVALLVFSSAAAGNHAMRLRAAGSDDSSNNYIFQTVYVSNTTNSASRSTATSIPVAYGGTTASTTISLYSPKIATPTRIEAPAQGSDGADTSPFIYHRSGLHNVSTAYDGFTVISASGTLTGTVSVYGYKK